MGAPWVGSLSLLGLKGPLGLLGPWASMDPRASWHPREPRGHGQWALGHGPGRHPTFVAHPLVVYKGYMNHFICMEETLI